MMTKLELLQLHLALIMELSIKQARCQIEFEGKHIMLKFPVTTRNTSTWNIYKHNNLQIFN